MTLPHNAPGNHLITSNRNLTIDVFRAFAIVLITGSHVLKLIHCPTKPFYFWDLYGPFLKGGVGTALFVFISGYLMHTTSFKRPISDFIKKRFFRLLIPYYTALFVWNLLLSFKILEGRHDFFDNLTHIFLVHNLFPRTFFSIAGVFWYIPLLIHLFVLYFLLRPFIRKNGIWVLSITFIICAITNIVTPHYFSVESQWFPFITRSVFSYAFVFFLPAVLLRRKYILKKFLKNPWVWTSLLILAIHWLFLSGFLIKCDGLDIILKGTLWGLIMLGMPKTIRVNFINRPFVILGQAAYSIYLYNYIFLITRPQLSSALEFFICLFFTLFLGIAMYYLIERPFIRKPKNEVY